MLLVDALCVRSDTIWNRVGLEDSKSWDVMYAFSSKYFYQIHFALMYPVLFRSNKSKAYFSSLISSFVTPGRWKSIDLNEVDDAFWAGEFFLIIKI